MDNSYTGSLESLSENSNEDEIVALTFLQGFKGGYVKVKWVETSPSSYKILRTFDTNLNWLDVGSGSGRKLSLILRGLSVEFEVLNSGVYEGTSVRGLLERSYKNINLDIIEPDINSISELETRFKLEGLQDILKNRFQTIWEQFETDKKYDLITFFHSVYGIDRELLVRIPDFLTDDGIACIVVETYGSALNKVKRELSDYLPGFELASTSSQIKQFLDSKGIKYSELFGGTGQGNSGIQQKFYVDDLIFGGDDTLESLSFLFLSTPGDQGKKVPREVLVKARKELMKYARKERTGRTYVLVPDGFIWVHNNFINN